MRQLVPPRFGRPFDSAAPGAPVLSTFVKPDNQPVYLKEEILYSPLGAEIRIDHKNGGVSTHIIRDHLGTPKVLVRPDTENVEWLTTLAYGESVPESTFLGLLADPLSLDPDRAFTPVGFAGSPQDGSTGLSVMGHRYYDNQTMRFISPDPSNLAIRYTRPSSWNLYQYANNNPVNVIDPTGLFGEAEGGTNANADDGVAISPEVIVVIGKSSLKGEILSALADAVTEVGIAGIIKNVIVVATGENPITGEKVGVGGRILAGVTVALNAGTFGVGGAVVKLGAKVTSAVGSKVMAVAKSSKRARRARRTMQAVEESAEAGGKKVRIRNQYGGGKSGKHANVDARNAAAGELESARQALAEAKASGASSKVKAELKRKIKHLRKAMDFTGESHHN